jgi:hypothetical protein
LDMFRGKEAGDQFQSSANSASRGCGGPRGRGYCGGCGRDNGGRNGGGRGNVNHDNSKQGGTCKILYQICSKTGHEARDCWYCYDDDDEYQHKTAGTAAAGYRIDTNWYADSGSSDHITSELEKMTVRDKYSGQD